ncbi:MAG TPA: hypothetical protein VJ770_12770 [Stellaceae bacterium]|nr:hypothetical protein [Stellaceae bacterium]
MSTHLYLFSIGLACGIGATSALAAPSVTFSRGGHFGTASPPGFPCGTCATPAPATTQPSNQSQPASSPGSSSTPAPASAPGDGVITVGPGGQYQSISAAVAAADADTDPSHSYVIEVMPGTYTNDFPTVTRPMTIKVSPGQEGQPVVLQATENLPNEKGIILTFASLTVNGLTFTGAQIDNSLGGNGAGIRDENTGTASLIVQNSTFTGNQEGILSDGDLNETITIVNSTFKNNGNPDPDYFQHGIYIGRAGSLNVSNSLFCGQLIGHDIKSRAAVTTVANNSIYHGQEESTLGCNAGSSSFAIDLPNGGVATISGNQIVQGAAAQNHNMVAYGEEGLPYGNNSALVSSNTFTSTAGWNATAILDPPCVTIELSGNTFQGVTTVVNPPTCAAYQ